MIHYEIKIAYEILFLNVLNNMKKHDLNLQSDIL